MGMIKDFTKVIKKLDGNYSYDGMFIPNDVGVEEPNHLYREIEEFINNGGIISEEPPIQLSTYKTQVLSQLYSLIDGAHDYFLEGASLPQQFRYKLKADMAKMILDANANGTYNQLLRDKAEVVYAFKVEANLEKIDPLVLAQRVYTKYCFLTYKIMPLLETIRRSLQHGIEIATTKEAVDIVLQKTEYIKDNVLQMIVVELQKGTNLVSLFDQLNKLFNS